MAESNSFFIKFLNNLPFKKVIWAVLLYILVCGIYYNYQERFFFKPTPFGTDAAYQFENANFNVSYTPIIFDSANKFDVARFSPKTDSAKGIVIYFHGNSGNIGTQAKRVEVFTNNGYECWVMDYPGYGRSIGNFDLENIYSAAGQLYKMATAKYGPDQVIIYGFSFGTTIASNLATHKQSKAVVLEAPLYNIQSLVKRYLFFIPVNALTKYEIQNNENISRIKAPVTIFHGTEDNTVPYKQSQKLVPLLNPKDKFITIENGTHKDVYTNPVYTDAIKQILGAGQ